MIRKIRKSKFSKAWSLLILFSILNQVILPVSAFALGGPGQPEVQGFEPVGTNDLVDLFSGDFTYNIPLLDAGGYPVNISYHSGIGMDQEAGWVGLGWSLVPGVINRGIRGLPDDMLRDPVKKEFNIRSNKTFGGNITFGDTEVIGGGIINISLGFGFGMFYNTYNKMGHEYSFDPGISIGDKQKSTLDFHLGLTYNTQSGINLQPGVGLSIKANKTSKDELKGTAFGGQYGETYNSRAGLVQRAYGASVQAYMKTPKGSKSSQAINGGAEIPTNFQTYSPQITMWMRNVSGSVHAGLGGEGKWLNFKGRLSGYFTDQDLMSTEQISPAYGYLYSDWGIADPFALHDMNRENDGNYSKSTPGLPLTNYTYDVLNVNGQGIGGNFRPYRGDVGTVFDNMGLNVSFSTQGGADFGGGDVGKGGGNFGINFNIASSGRWSGGVKAAKSITFKNKGNIISDFPEYESVYYKQAGEMVPADVDFQNKFVSDKPVRLEINQEGEALAELKYRDPASPLFLEQSKFLSETDNHFNLKINRDKRNQVISFLNADKAKNYAQDKDIISYALSPKGNTGMLTTNAIARTAAPAKGHHISEISMLRPDGARYIFGIPAYNLFQQDATFNVAAVDDLPNFNPSPALPVDFTKDLVTYAQSDMSTGNKRGIDHYFNRTTLPPHAHSYLLTSVLSPDYVDRKSDGPTTDDLGSYTAFKYKRFYDAANPFHWRVPFEANQANFNKGLRADENDDKASVIYGQKELWYLQIIETKTHVAEFYLSAREDGFGANGLHGGINKSAPIYKLDSICLYNLCDRRENKEKAVPIKVVVFAYDYLLCKGIPNGTLGGKLTLTGIHFKYGHSKKGKLTGYKFHYDNVNPAYNMKDTDAWGTFKKGQNANCDPKGLLCNSEYPYALQNKSTADKNAAAWTLSAIDLPSGGTIKVAYESDDYAYVQDKRAMQMVKVTGLGSSSVESTDRLYDGNTNRPFVHLELPGTVISDDDFKNKYLVDEKNQLINDLYFKFLIDVIGRKSGLPPDEDKYEYVSGWAKIKSYGVDANTNKAWIELETVDISEKNNEQVSPILKTALQFVRLHLPNLVYPANVDEQSPVENKVRSLLGFVTDFKSIVNGFNRTLKSWDYAQKVVLHKSMLRLHATGFKLGGGLRVKKVVMQDNWSKMVNSGSGTDAEYGQEYEYTTIKDGSVTAANPNGIPISSGVATYEPMMMNDENPWHQPLAYTEEHKAAPDNEFVQDLPMGKSFFPGPAVGYSEVRVRNLAHAGVARHATGFVQHKFYTAKDYPVYTAKTRIQSYAKKPKWLRKILKIDVADELNVSGGHAIFLTNMGGQKRAEWVYPEYPPGTPADEIKPISGVEYFYKTSSEFNNRLDNTVTVVNPDGSMDTKLVGREIDVVADLRENKSFAMGTTFAFNIDVSTTPTPVPLPLPLPSFWPGFTSEKTRFRMATMTKVATQYGILEKTVAYDNGSRVSTENLAFDSETGEVLLTKTINEFQDPVYNFTYPAHWGYDRMGMAYRNLGILFINRPISGGNININNAPSYFVKGDELANNSGERWWVVDVNANDIRVVDKDGKTPNYSFPVTNIEIIRSGRRNMQALPIGTIASRSDPSADGKIDGFKEVLNAGAVEYEERWPLFCECEDLFPSAKTGPVNPYRNGTLGNWRAKRSLVFLTERLQSSLNRNTNIRKDGAYGYFEPFWTPPLAGGEWKAGVPATNMVNNWTYTSEITLFSPFGFELENRDPLDRYSAATYGYGNTLPTAVASNARYKEIGFDNFEENAACKTCAEDHFGFKETGSIKITSDESHSGRKSLKIPPGEKVTFSRLLIDCEALKNQ